jgi:hypothetical protein
MLAIRCDRWNSAGSETYSEDIAMRLEWVSCRRMREELQSVECLECRRKRKSFWRESGSARQKSSFVARNPRKLFGGPSHKRPHRPLLSGLSRLISGELGEGFAQPTRGSGVDEEPAGFGVHSAWNKLEARGLGICMSRQSLTARRMRIDEEHVSLFVHMRYHDKSAFTCVKR